MLYNRLAEYRRLIITPSLGPTPVLQRKPPNLQQWHWESLASPLATWLPRLITHPVAHSLSAEQTPKLASGRSPLSQFLLEHSAFLKARLKCHLLKAESSDPSQKPNFSLCAFHCSLSPILELLPHVHRSSEVSSSLGQDQRVALQRSTPAEALDLRSSHLSRHWPASTPFCPPDPSSAESRRACTHSTAPPLYCRAPPPDPLPQPPSLTLVISQTVLGTP